MANLSLPIVLKNELINSNDPLNELAIFSQSVHFGQF